MNELAYKLEIETEKSKNESIGLKGLILLDKKIEIHILNFKRLFADFDIKRTTDDDAQLFFNANVDSYDYVISTPFMEDEETLITNAFKIPGNKKHIVLLNDKITTQDILHMSKYGNVLYLGNNLEVIENIEVLTGFLTIIKKQKIAKATLLKYEPDQLNQQRTKVLVYTNVVVIQNILTKALEDTSITESRYDFVRDDKTFFSYLSDHHATTKIVILTSENPPLDEVKMITKLSTDIKIIYVASTKDDRLLRELSQKGVDQFIYKPFDFENIKDTLRIADNKEQKTDTKIILYSIKELIENFNLFIQREHISPEEKSKFKNYFKFLQ